MGLGVIGTAGSPQPSGHPSRALEVPRRSAKTQWAASPARSERSDSVQCRGLHVTGWLGSQGDSCARGRVLQGRDRDGVALEPRVSLQALCLSARGPGTHEHGCSQSGASMSCPRSP